MQRTFLLQALVLLAGGVGAASAKSGLLPQLQYSTSIHAIKALEGTSKQVDRGKAQAQKRLIVSCCEIPLDLRASDDILVKSPGPSSLGSLLMQLARGERHKELAAVTVVGHESCKHLDSAITGADEEVLHAIEAYVPDFSALIATARDISTYAKDNPKTTLGGIWLSSKTTDLGKALLETAYPQSSPHWGIRVPPERLEEALNRGIAVANVYWLGNAVTAWWEHNGSQPITVSGSLWRKDKAPGTIDVYNEDLVNPKSHSK